MGNIAKALCKAGAKLGVSSTETLTKVDLFPILTL